MLNVWLGLGTKTTCLLKCTGRSVAFGITRLSTLTGHKMSRVLLSTLLGTLNHYGVLFLLLLIVLYIFVTVIKDAV